MEQDVQRLLDNMNASLNLIHVRGFDRQEVLDKITEHLQLRTAWGAKTGIEIRKRGHVFTHLARESRRVREALDPENP